MMFSQVAEASYAVISTVAGSTTATCGYGGDGGPAASPGPVLASSKYTTSGQIDVDEEGNLYIGESSRIRKVTKSTGIISTVVGGGTGSIFDGVLAIAVSLSDIWSLAVDPTGSSLYFVSVSTSSIVWKCNHSGVLSSFAALPIDYHLKNLWREPLWIRTKPSISDYPLYWLLHHLCWHKFKFHFKW